MRAALVLGALLACGCHESTGLVGDARTDPTVDTAFDVLTETHIDPGLDEACPPASDDVWLSWTLDGVEWDWGREFDIPCVVVSVTVEDVDHTIIELTCSTGGLMEPHVIELFSNPHPSLEYLTGTEVILDYASIPREWQERWLALRHVGGDLIIAGTTGCMLWPPSSGHYEWYYPLYVWGVVGLCPQEEWECGLIERAALDVEFRDDQALVFDGSSTILGGVEAAQVTVDEGWYNDTRECLDLPRYGFNALFVILPEG